MSYNADYMRSWIASFLAMTGYMYRHCEHRAWENPLQKRVMTIQVAVIASGAKQSRTIDYVWINDFVIISNGHWKNPLQKRVMTSQVAVIASRAKQSRSLDNVRLNDFVIIRNEAIQTYLACKSFCYFIV